MATLGGMTDTLAGQCRVRALEIEVQPVAPDAGAGDDENRARVAVDDETGQEKSAAGDHQDFPTTEGPTPSDDGRDIVVDARGGELRLDEG